MPVLTELIALLRQALKDRTQFMQENIGLRHQLAVDEQSVGHTPRLAKARVAKRSDGRMTSRMRVLSYPRVLSRFTADGLFA